MKRRMLAHVETDGPYATHDAHTAICDLVSTMQQLRHPLENAREIEQCMRLERVLILPERPREDTPDAARHHRVQVAPESLNRIRDQRSQLGRGGAVAAPGVLGIAVRRTERCAGEPLAARLPFLRQEI